jgi:hypothetical protein
MHEAFSVADGVENDEALLANTQLSRRSIYIYRYTIYP